MIHPSLIMRSLLVTALPLVALILNACLPLQAAPRSKQISASHVKLLDVGEKNTSPAGRKVLETGRKMTLDQKVIIPGGCWGYADAVYNKAGFDSKQRKRVFNSKKNGGPYAKTSQIQPGDWLYHVNHGYKGVEHSAIFVAWIDERKKIGLMLSYGGEHRKEPARYRAYDLRSTYQIHRPVL